MTESTWANRELPILKVALRRIDAGEQVSLEEIRQEVGLDVAQMRVAVDALEGARYIKVYHYSMGPDVVGGMIEGLGERTRRELGSWPTPAGVLDDLVAALKQAAENKAEPERRSRLETVANGLSSFARDVAVGVITAKLGGL